MQPSLMPGVRVGSRLLADGHAIVDVLPVLRRGIGRIDAERLDGIDGLQHPLDFRPPGNAQQAFAAGTHIRHGDVALARRDCAQDIDARFDASVVVPGPADEGEDAPRLRYDAPLAVDDMLIDDPTEADPVLDLLPDPQELDMREFGHAAPRGLGGNSRDSRSRSISAAVIPHRNAATLMRPRRSGVTSIVSRAVK